MADNTRKRRISSGKQTAARLEKVADALDIPKDFLAGTMKITLLGNEEITICGALCIIEYTDTTLRLNTRNFILTITGKNFEVKDLDTEYLKLVGEIESVSYMT